MWRDRYPGEPTACRVEPAKYDQAVWRTVTVDFTFTLESGESAGAVISKLVSYFEGKSPSAKVMDRSTLAAVLRRGSVFGINLGIKTTIEISGSDRSANSSVAVVTYKVHSILGGEFARANFREKLSQEIETFKVRFISDTRVGSNLSGPGLDSSVSELERLVALLERGLLTREEFDAAKKRIIE